MSTAQMAFEKRKARLAAEKESDDEGDGSGYVCGTCAICGFTDFEGSCTLVGPCEKCKRDICDDCRATDVLNGDEIQVHDVEDFGYESVGPVCQACYDARA